MRFAYCTDTGEWDELPCEPDTCDGEHEIVSVDDDELRDKMLAAIKGLRSIWFGLEGGSNDVMGRVADCYREITGQEIFDH